MKKSLSLVATLALCSISMPSFAIITTQNSTNVAPSKNAKKILSAQELAQLVQSSGRMSTASPVAETQANESLHVQESMTQNHVQSTATSLTPVTHLSQAQPTTPTQQPAVTLKSSNIEPKLSLGVFTLRNDAVVPANTTLLSRSNPEHRLCWIAFDAVFPNQVDVEENITAPAPSQFTGATSRTISSTDGLHHSIFTTLTSANNQIVERCWQFDVNDPIGIYQISIKVGEVNYPAQKFQIVQ